MRRNPGQWLRERLFDRTVAGALLLMAGTGWLLGVVLAQIAPTSAALAVGAVFIAAGIGKLLWGSGQRSGRWRLNDMRKGAYAEELIGQAIEYALVRSNCAVAHGVTEVAKVGDIDHLVATSRRLWVVESKQGRVPKKRFRETLRRIAENVEEVREWAPEAEVAGALVFVGDDGEGAKKVFFWGDEPILCFESRQLLMRALRDEAETKASLGSDLLRKVWMLGRVE